MAINVAGDNATAIKQAEEFGLVAQGMKIVPMSFQNVDIQAVGLKATRGDLILTKVRHSEDRARSPGGRDRTMNLMLYGIVWV